MIIGGSEFDRDQTENEQLNPFQDCYGMASPDECFEGGQSTSVDVIPPEIYDTISSNTQSTRKRKINQIKLRCFDHSHCAKYYDALFILQSEHGAQSTINIVKCEEEVFG